MNDPQARLDEIASRARWVLTSMVERPGMWAGFMESYHQGIYRQLDLLEHIWCGPETKYTEEVLDVLVAEVLGGSNALVPWCRFVYLLEGDDPTDEIREQYFTMPQNTEHPHHQEIMGFYRRWVEMVLEKIGEVQ